MSCENVLMAMMAEADGEVAELSQAEINEHLHACEDCRDEAVRMQRVDNLLRQATRSDTTFDLWPAVSSGLEQRASERRWLPYAIVGVLLLVHKLFEMLPTKDPGWAIKFVPLIIFGALLVFLRENPFRINSELVLEK